MMTFGLEAGRGIHGILRNSRQDLQLVLLFVPVQVFGSSQVVIYLMQIGCVRRKMLKHCARFICLGSTGLVPFAIGSETAGSMTYPAARCGATAIRPTFGTVGRTGVMSISESLVTGTHDILFIGYWVPLIGVESVKKKSMKFFFYCYGRTSLVPSVEVLRIVQSY